MRLTSIGLATLVLGAGVLRAQGTLTGIVREDSTGRALAGAEVSIDAAKRRAITDSAGRYILAKVPAGLHQVQARLIGYYPAATMIRLAGEETRQSDLSLGRVTADLDPVVVRDSRRGGSGVGLAGFEERRRLGFGKFIDSTELRANEHRRLGDMLGAFPFVRLVAQKICKPDDKLPQQRRTPQQCRDDTYRRVAMSTKKDGLRQECPMRVYLDDILVYRGLPARQLIDWEGTFDVNSVQVSSLAAVEVYRGTSEMPMAYSGNGDECGVLVLWTRRR